MRIDFNDIVINEAFKTTHPSEKKMQKCREAYNKGELDRDIVINSKNVLVDGYVLYCVMKEDNYKGHVEVKQNSKFINTPTTYIFGRHLGQDNKERCWYINMSYDKVKDKVGEIADVMTKHGISSIKITRIERLNNPPVEGVIRRVVHI